MQPSNLCKVMSNLIYMFREDVLMTMLNCDYQTLIDLNLGIHKNDRNIIKKIKIVCLKYGVSCAIMDEVELSMCETTEGKTRLLDVLCDDINKGVGDATHKS